MKRIDALAKWMIKTLQGDARTSASEMARRMDMRIASLTERVKNLTERDKVITGFTIEVDEKKLGWNITTVAIIVLESNRSEELKAFEDMVFDMPEVLECQMIKGNADFFIKFLAKDLEDEDRIIRLLANSRNVKSIRAFETIRCAFRRGADPGNE